jgi:hypothetical protein
MQAGQQSVEGVQAKRPGKALMKAEISLRSARDEVDRRVDSLRRT